MPQGIIKKFTDRGFGFIDTGGKDLFFHHSALQNRSIEELHEGSKPWSSKKTRARGGLALRTSGLSKQ
jgi:cold shock CspA family protein